MALHPAGGPRKLVIKNLRVSRDNRALEDYYDQVWAELDNALTDIFASRQPRIPFERIYKGVEDICRKGEASKLADVLSKRCQKHLEGDVYDTVSHASSFSPDDNITALDAVSSAWQTWSQQLRILRTAFAYLDRSYLLNVKAKESAEINDMAIRAFGAAVFGTSRHLQSRSIGDRAISAVCELVDHDRRGDSRFNSNLLKDSISMMRILGVYHKTLEPRFLSESAAFFKEIAKDRGENYSLKDYIVSCEKLLDREKERMNLYNFDSLTKKTLLQHACTALVQDNSPKLLDTANVSRLLDDRDLVSIRQLYGLLKLSSIESRVREPWTRHIMDKGDSIVGDVERGDDMVVQLLLLRRSLDVMVRDALEGNEIFTHGMRDAFGQFINSKTVNSKWKTGTSKVGEMIAKYMDMLLRGGLKTLPASLLSDKKDRDAAERSGVASTADEDAELDRQLDAAIDLFRFIDGKDVFEAFYKRDLARRLLTDRSASQDAERNMIAKLRTECGSAFTNNLEQMFKDQGAAKQDMVGFKAWCEGNGYNDGALDFGVQILAQSAWPTYPDIDVLLPKAVLARTANFEEYYGTRHSGRKLQWKHNISNAVVSARFNKGRKELVVSAFQSIVLLLFNEAETEGHDGVLSYKQIAGSTGLVDKELQRVLQSLACGKLRVLTKHPKGREVAPTDTFTVNKGFWDPKFRLKINVIQLKETAEENKATHERVEVDRQFEAQAAIVRIMKTRKTMPHAQLVAEVIQQTSKRGALDPQQIKNNIERYMASFLLSRPSYH